MKEAALKESESKRVIIATYSMASEALDIKTLTTLIMATPKTDIEQAVGRILRQKHTAPIVVDIIDAHEVFVRQWFKRCTFYKKQKYSIVQTSFDAYSPDVTQWTGKRTKATTQLGVKKKVVVGTATATATAAATHESVIAMLNRSGMGGEGASSTTELEPDAAVESDMDTGTEDAIFTKCLISINR
jgi:superfamily II DNA or RNA helicase